MLAAGAGAKCSAGDLPCARARRQWHTQLDGIASIDVADLLLVEYPEA